MADTIEAGTVYFSTRRIVFTCGCFDLLHIGHVNFLRQAKQLGDELIVGIHRCADKNPVLPIYHRQVIIQEVCGADNVIVHEHGNDEQIIQEFNITHWAIGPEWDEAHQRHDGIEYVIIPRVPNISTSDIKQRCYEAVRDVRNRRYSDSGDHYHLRNP